MIDMGDQMDGGSWTELLSSKYFGLSDPYTGRIIDGRWENTSIPYMTAEFYTEEGIDRDQTFFPAENAQW
jgi:hypothetical protein